jgi:uncharacterized protein (DUF2132 family)
MKKIIISAEEPESRWKCAYTPSAKYRDCRNCMKSKQPNNPLHGKTLDIILHHLEDQYGWEQLGVRIKIKCFNDNPSIQSCLKFLRKTPWARIKVENLYLENIGD